jgi:hypothetical protein
VSRKLSALCVFVTLNYLYCDVMSLMDRSMLKQYLTGDVGGVHISHGFLLGSAVLMEIPIAMVVLSLLLPYRANRWANIAAGAVMTAVQFATLFVGSAPASYYIFFSIVEIATTGLIA